MSYSVNVGPLDLTRVIHSGFATGSKPGVPNISGGPATGSNAVAVPVSVASTSEHDLEKEEKRRKKAERKEEKRAQKEEKKRRKAEREDEERSGRRHHHRSRSRSPHRRSKDHDDRSRSRHRSRTPIRSKRDSSPYDDVARERERERDRRRWEENARREQPGGSRWGRG